MGRDRSEPGEGPHRLDGKSQGCGTPWKLQKTASLFKNFELREMRPGFIHSLMLPKGTSKGFRTGYKAQACSCSPVLGMMSCKL